MERKNLYAKLLELQKGCRSLGKDARAFGYQYVSGSKLLDYVRPKMDELGLLLIPHTADFSEREVNTGKRNEVLVTLHKEYTWCDVDSGETLTTSFVAQGCNGWDKGLGSAETYAERYFLLKFFHIATDSDDVDAIVREPMDSLSPTAQAIPHEDAAQNLVEALVALKNARNRDELVAAHKRYATRFVKNEDYYKVLREMSQKYPKEQTNE